MKTAFIVKKTSIHVLAVLLFFTCLFYLFFLPIIGSQRFLAPGDSFIQSVPSFQWGLALWNPYLFSGFPQFADPQAMFWYPLRILFKPLSFNAFIISAYVMAGSFTYGYVYKLTKMISVSLFSGIAFSMSGFLMAHLGHVNIIHTACWLPLILWGLENIKEKKPLWILFTAFSIFNCILAGHPQIMFYTLTLSSLYFLFLSFNRKKFDWRLFVKFSLVMVTGILLSSIQLIPTFELMQQSVRSNMTFQMFNEYSMPLKEVIILFFPYLFGGIKESIYEYSYFGKWNLTEITGYMGWLPIIFASIIIFHRTSFKNKYVLFWFFVACFSFLLTLGDATFLSKIMYHIPGYNLFRVPARNFMEYSFALSVLGGLGLKKLLEINIRKRLIVQGALLLIMTFTIVLFIGSYDFTQKALEKGVTNVEPNIFMNKSVIIPFTLLLLGVVVLCLIKGIRNKIYPLSMILILLIVELSSFGWFYEWRFDASPYSVINQTPSINTEENRIVVTDGSSTQIPSLRPNISQLFLVRNIVGYNPLLLKEYKQLVGVETNGIIDKSALNQNILDILSVKYSYRQDQNKKTNSNEISFKPTPLDLHLSLLTKKSILFNIDHFNGDQLGIVMRLSNSVGLKDETVIAKIEVQYNNDMKEEFPIIVGENVSEWAIDRNDVSKAIQHKKAIIYNSFSVENDNSFLGHNYIAMFNIKDEMKVNSISIIMQDIKDAYLDLDKISLFNSKERISYQLSLNDTLYSEPNEWNEVEKSLNIYEKKDALPRIRSVEQVLTYPQEAILPIIKSGKLPNGVSFDPRKMTLVADNKINHTNYSNNGTVQVNTEENDKLIIQTNFPETSFLTISDVFYNGWKAYIDGVETPIYKTNYILRGIEVPEGEHKIEMIFSPNSLKLGFIITMLGFMLSLTMFFIGRHKYNGTKGELK